MVRGILGVCAKRCAWGVEEYLRVAGINEGVHYFETRHGHTCHNSRAGVHLRLPEQLHN